eukprot:5380593-Amphidinium_carterae.2
MQVGTWGPVLQGAFCLGGAVMATSILNGNKHIEVTFHLLRKAPIAQPFSEQRAPQSSESPILDLSIVQAQLVLTKQVESAIAVVKQRDRLFTLQS